MWTHSLRRGVPSLKLPMKRESCYNLEQIYAITAIISQGSTYKGKVLVDVRNRVMMMSWYIQLSRASDPANVALLTPLTYDMLLEFARNAAVTDTAFSADKAGASAGAKEKGKKDKAMGTRHMLPEAARLRRLARGSRDDARLRSEDGGSRNRRSKAARARARSASGPNTRN